MVRLLKDVQIANISQESFGVIATASSAYYNDLLQFLGTLKTLDDAGRAAIIEMIARKPEMVGQSYASLIQSGGENMLLGIAFEQIVKGRFQAEAARRGIKLEWFEGDGLGTLPNGQKTPQHSDLVFRDKQSKLYSMQLKYSDSKANVENMVKDFFNTHGGKPGDPSYPQLNVENTEIIVPKGLEKQHIDVDVRGSKQTVATKSKVEVGDMKVDAPSVDDMKNFLKKNFEVMQKINKDALVQQNKRLLRSNQQLNKSIGKIQEKLSEIPVTEKTAEIRKKYESDIEGWKKTIQRNDQQLSENVENLSKQELANRGTNAFSLKLALKTVAVQCAAAAAVGGITALVISFDQNYDLYKKNQITGLQLFGNVMKDTGKAAGISAGIAGIISGGSAACQYLAASSSVTLQRTGFYLGRALGPVVLVGAIAVQVCTCITDYP